MPRSFDDLADFSATAPGHGPAPAGAWDTERTQLMDDAVRFAGQDFDETGTDVRTDPRLPGLDLDAPEFEELTDPATLDPAPTRLDSERQEAGISALALAAIAFVAAGWTVAIFGTGLALGIVLAN